MRAVFEQFNAAFARLDADARKLLSLCPDELLFESITDRNGEHAASFGECVIRSAAEVEQTFDGITTRLWDDPFEWTLPEKLSDKALITQYFDEVAATRVKGFGYFTDDSDLGRKIPAPDEFRSIGELLLRTISRSESQLGRAELLFRILTAKKPPRR